MEIDNFLAPLKKLHDAKMVIAQNGTIALGEIKSDPPTFVIVDEGLPDFTPLELVTEIMKVNAMINTAVVSSLSAEDFHEASEGLGVLSPIPPTPSEEDGATLADLFTQFV